MKTLPLKQIPNALQFLRYKLAAGNDRCLHSPFVFNFYNQVLKGESKYYVFDKIESVRSKMVLSDEQIEVHDFGTGGKIKQPKMRSLAFITKQYVKPVKEAQILFRLINYFRPMNILELGTSIGITTMYLASPDSKSNVLTLEGCSNTAEVARKNFEIAGIKNIKQVIGEFSKTLPETVSKTAQLDFVYFDGNHRKMATLEYFQQCLTKHHEQTIFVFDDIYWSKEMTEAWKIIQQHESVTMTIDLFFIGIVFFRKEFPKQHFVLKW